MEDEIHQLFYARIGQLELSMDTETTALTPFVVIDSDLIVARASWLFPASDAVVRLRCCDERKVLGVVAADYGRDIAILKIDPPYPGYDPIPFSTDRPSVGDPLTILFTLPIQFDGIVGYGSSDSVVIWTAELAGIGQITTIESDTSLTYPGSLVLDVNSTPIGILGGWGGGDESILALFDEFLALDRFDSVPLHEFNPSNDSLANQSQALSLWSATLRHEDELLDALDAAASAVELDPLNWYAYYQLGVLKDLAFNDLSGSLEELDRSINLEPDWIEAQFSRGLVYFKLGKHVQAEHSLRTALELIPSHPDSLSMLGLTLWELYGAEDAIELLAKACDAAPDRYMFIANLNHVLTELDREQEVSDRTLDFLNANPDHIEARSDLAKLKVTDRDLNGAKLQYKLLIQKDPNNPDWIAMLAFTQIRTGQVSQGEANLNKVKSINPNHALIEILEKDLRTAKD
ncbi:MAG: hypothetical protein JKY96_04890 [Phycisphaerales bacterium]|nr:hypothetical protein [Phycisphaerales bacterium]